MRSQKAKEVALLGVLFALAIALSFLESAVSPALGLLPAMKLGLSNVVVMYAVLCLSRRHALELVLLKALFAFAVRGATAGLLSLAGGALSFAVFCVFLALPLPVTGFIFSVCGALAHNAGQLLAAACILSDRLALGYAPVLMAAGVAVGSVTYAITKALLPALRAAQGSGTGTKAAKHILF